LPGYPPSPPLPLMAETLVTALETLYASIFFCVPHATKLFECKVCIHQFLYCLLLSFVGWTDKWNQSINQWTNEQWLHDECSRTGGFFLLLLLRNKKGAIRWHPCLPFNYWGNGLAAWCTTASYIISILLVLLGVGGRPWLPKARISSTWCICRSVAEALVLLLRSSGLTCNSPYSP
jgi:hypothetical protein